jgi:hypothetical protein
MPKKGFKDSESKPQAVRSIFEQRVLEEIRKRRFKRQDRLAEALKALEKKP